jgi:hypothetical protein
MDKNNIDNLVEWVCNTNGIQFAEQIYQRSEPDSYTKEKFYQMQTNLFRWIANLDGKNRQRLANAINNLNKLKGGYIRKSCK